MTTVLDLGLTVAAVESTWSIIGSPATRWSTVASADFMRVPLPAARITRWTSIFNRVGPHPHARRARAVALARIQDRTSQHQPHARRARAAALARIQDRTSQHQPHARRARAAALARIQDRTSQRQS